MSMVELLTLEAKPPAEKFAIIPLTPEVLALKVGVRQVYAGMLALSFVDVNGQRIFDRSDADLASLLGCHPKTVKRNLGAVSAAGLVLSTPHARLVKSWPKESRVVYLALKSPVWKLDPLDFAVWLAIASFGNKRGVFVWPGDEVLAERAGSGSAKNMMDGLKSLAAIGAIRSQPARIGSHQLKRQVAVNLKWDGSQAPEKVVKGGTKTAVVVNRNSVDAGGQKPSVEVDKNHQLVGTKAISYVGQKPSVEVSTLEVLTSEDSTLEVSSANPVSDEPDAGGQSENCCCHQKEDLSTLTQDAVGEEATPQVGDLLLSREEAPQGTTDPLGWQAPSAVEAMSPQEYALWASSDWLYGPDIAQSSESPQSVQAMQSPQEVRASEAPTPLEPILKGDVELAPAAVTSAPVVVDGRDGPLVGQGGVSGAEVGRRVTSLSRGVEGLPSATGDERDRMAQMLASVRAHRAATVTPPTSKPDA